MPTPSDALNLREGYLSRPRIDSLLRKGLNYPLMTVIAGPGYSKTHSVEAFVQRHRTKHAWVQLSRLDNIPQRFWSGLLRSLAVELPQLAERFADVPFPTTLAQVDEFLRYLADNLNDDTPFLLVLDNCQQVSNAEVIAFVETLIEARLDSFTLVLISSAALLLTTATLRSPEQVHVLTAQDLKFTPEEASALFALHHTTLSESMLESIYDQTEGWPLALYLLALERTLPDRLLYPGFVLELSHIIRLFEKEFYQSYTESVQRMLLMLAFFPSFPLELVEALDGMGHLDDFVDILHTNMFITYDFTTRMYSFQRMYRTFLIQRQFQLPSRDIEQFHAHAGDWFAKHYYLLDAIECYGRAKKYDAMLETILSIPNARMSTGLAQFFQTQLELLPEEFYDENPIVEYLLTAIVLNNVDLDEATRRFSLLKQHCEEHALDPKFAAVLGETLFSLGSISMLQFSDELLQYYEQSAALLPLGSGVQKPGQMIVLNAYTLFTADYAAGALAHMERIMRQAAPYIEHIMHGDGHGIDWLFAAEAAYLTNDFVRAAECAYQAKFHARENDQHDIMCNAELILAQIELNQGNYKDCRARIDEVRQYIDSRRLTTLYDLRDYATGLFSLYMSDYVNIAPWILDNGKPNQAPMNIGRERLILARYMLSQGNYFELIALLTHMENLCLRRGLWTERIYISIYRASCYLKLNDKSKALDALWDAYERTHELGIVLPFIEAGNDMRSLVHLARQSDYAFSPTWLSEINSKANTFAKRLSVMVNEHSMQQRSRKSHPDQLTPQEKRTLLVLAQGLTRDEIANMQHISINTVKSTIRNIYSKLGALNRADAVRIATQRGLLEE